MKKTDFYCYEVLIDGNLSLQFAIIDKTGMFASCMLFIDAHSGWLVDFHIAECRRGNGIGRKLFNFVKREATRRYSIQSISGHVLYDEKVIKFWESINFFIVKQDDDGYIMTRRIK